MCRDAGQFLRAVFKRSVPLVLVDLPASESAAYWTLRDATDRARQVSAALVVVAGSGAVEGEELWARSLGAWSYLSEAHGQRGFEFVLSEARTALARKGVAEEPIEGAPEDPEYGEAPGGVTAPIERRATYGNWTRNTGFS
ncbi:MAG TPA: hypothetical protein VEQ85_08905 [Lacipirellulaceae bacterium]|nr:hypothetical protein [Lacipirellulaceae bacterium]